MKNLLAFFSLLVASPLLAQPVQFQQQIVPLLRVHCVGCHMTGSEPGGLALHPGKAYQSLVNVQANSAPLMRVKPKEPDASYLLHKLQGTHLEVGGDGVRMPFAMPALNNQEIDIIRRWIKEGALSQ